jgi:hypothetical protein
MIHLEIDDTIYSVEYDGPLPKFFIWKGRAFVIRFGTTNYEACGVAVVLPDDLGKRDCPHCGAMCSPPDRSQFDYDVQGQFYCDNCECGFDLKP